MSLGVLFIFSPLPILGGGRARDLFEVSVEGAEGIVAAFHGNRGDRSFSGQEQISGVGDPIFVEQCPKGGVQTLLQQVG